MVSVEDVLRRVVRVYLTHTDNDVLRSHHRFLFSHRTAHGRQQVLHVLIGGHFDDAGVGKPRPLDRRSDEPYERNVPRCHYTLRNAEFVGLFGFFEAHAACFVLQQLHQLREILDARFRSSALRLQPREDVLPEDILPLQHAQNVDDGTVVHRWKLLDRYPLFILLLRAFQNRCLLYAQEESLQGVSLSTRAKFP